MILIDQVARGLEVARLAGVVHRDLKPHNLFQHDGSVWKILDFGLRSPPGELRRMALSTRASRVADRFGPI